MQLVFADEVVKIKQKNYQEDHAFWRNHFGMHFGESFISLDPVSVYSYPMNFPSRFYFNTWDKKIQN